MSRPIQEYINGLINKPRIFYLDLNNHTESAFCSHCNQKTNQPTIPQLEGEISDLKEFTNLKGLNASNNQLTNLKFLETLPHKEKLKSLNLFGNQLKEIDFAWLLSTFPNLEKLNLQNNPVSAKNLNNLTSEQFSQLIQGIKAQKIKVSSWKGTILTDLLEYARQLAQQGHRQAHAHLIYLQDLAQAKPLAPKSDNLAEENHPSSSNQIPLLIGGLVLFGVAILAVGYWLGKRKKSPKKDQF